MSPITFALEWRFPSGMAQALAVHGARFEAPFWADFRIQGDTRSITLPDGTVITETLGGADAMGYRYTASGVDGISGYQGSFQVVDDGSATTLTWTTSFQARDSDAAARMVTINAGGGQAMLAELTAYFAPKPATPSRN
ncbi:hypothetical protein [Corallococcus llansteffanensis]|uniref:SRPBCC family protein n=1 Tax=Corallococcus llansteffanensis TaxID=2316731 RepID=A0A3A8PNH3_9BACT|nr:hypothetical protein [Corallococcus llansteffanensis]RKH56231.1 hypothetical protein D7V93_20620 [Corallococcus llansteffanensis]